MSKNLDVKVKIDLAKPVGKVGFGVPLLYQVNGMDKGAIPYTECYSMSDVVALGIDADGAFKPLYDAALAIFSQDNAPEKIAVECCDAVNAKSWLSNIANTSKNWRHFINVDGDYDAEVAEIIDTLEGKVYFADVKDTALASLTATHEKTVLCAYKGDTKFAAAIVGATAGLTIGSFTYKNIVLKGVTPDNYTETELSAIHAKNAIGVLTKAGDVVTSDGKTAAGEYIDIVDSNDYVVQNIEYKIQKLLNENKKVPYTDVGISMLQSAVTSALHNAFLNGIIDADENGNPVYTVNFALRNQTSEEDRLARKYPYGQFTYALVGAIHTVEVTGEIEL